MSKFATKIVLALISTAIALPVFATAGGNTEAMKQAKAKQNAKIASDASTAAAAPKATAKPKAAKKAVQTNPEDAAKNADPSK